MAKTYMSDIFIDEKDAAGLLGLSRQTLQQIRLNAGRKTSRWKKWKPVPHYKLGRLIRYKKEDLTEWLGKHKV